MANNTPSTNSPELLDKALLEIQKSLVANLSWLKTAYGKSQKITETDVDGRTISYPAIYYGQQYVSMIPVDSKGAFSFFEISDPQRVITSGKQIIRVEAEGSLIVWCDVRDIENYATDRNTERIKRLVSEAVLSTHSRGTNIKINRFYDSAERVYEKYGLKEISTQYLMYPYAAIRIDFTLQYTPSC